MSNKRGDLPGALETQSGNAPLWQRGGPSVKVYLNTDNLKEKQERNAPKEMKSNLAKWPDGTKKATNVQF